MKYLFYPITMDGAVGMGSCVIVAFPLGAAKVSWGEFIAGAALHPVAEDDVDGIGSTETADAAASHVSGLIGEYTATIVTTETDVATSRQKVQLHGQLSVP